MILHIVRISDMEYQINGVKVKKAPSRDVWPNGMGGDYTWQVRPLIESDFTRPMFEAETLEQAFNLIEGGIRMMSPAEES